MGSICWQTRYETFITITHTDRMAITKITLENFKGVSEKVTVPFRPITLLFGANSAGKSTLLQAMLYLRELLAHRDANVDRLHVSGQSIDLGGFCKIVHGRDTTRRVKVGVTISLDDDYIINTYGRAAYSDDDAAEGIRIEDQLPLPLTGVQEVTVTVTAGWDPDFKFSHVFSYEVAINGQKVGSIDEPLLNPSRRTFATLKIVEDHPIFASLFRFGNTPRRRGKGGKKTVGQLGYLATPKYRVLGVVLPRLGQPLRLLEMKGTKSTQMSTQDAEELFSHVMIGSGEAVMHELNKIRYIGPLRIVPNRDYKPVLTEIDNRWADGAAAWDLLHKLDDDLAWFDKERYEQLDLGHRLDIYRYYEVDVRSPLGECLGEARRRRGKGLAERPLPAEQVREHSIERQRLRVTTKQGMEVEPADIGVGVSQVIPVIVGAMAPGCSLLAVEQPELHVHPAVQCRLGDLLAHELVGQDGGRQALLETHSEHLMLRLLRRVRETTEGELPAGAPKISPEDLSVLYVSNEDGTMKITELPVTPDGDFARPWPKGFFEERSDELF